MAQIGSALIDESAATAPLPGFSEDAVSAIIEDRINRGVYPPGSRVPAERALAEELGVSRRFVRLAYSRLIERGILEKSHYRRPFVAFSGNLAQIRQRSGPSGAGNTTGTTAIQTIAAILPSHPKFPGGLSCIAGIHKVLTEVDTPYRLTFLDTFHQDRSEVLRREAQAIHTAVDDDAATGILWWYYSDEETVEKIVRQHPETAFVFIDRHPHSLACDFTGLDDQESSQAAVEYLIGLQHKRIAHLMDPGNYSTILERYEGYRTALTEHGLPIDESLVVHLDWDERRMEKAFDHFFSLPDPPTALFTSNDFIAYEFMEVAQARGIRIPEDLSVVGHGNIDRYTPREFLTSVDQPFEKIGRSAANLLVKRLSPGNADRPFQHVILPAPLVVRRSCRKWTDEP